MITNQELNETLNLARKVHSAVKIQYKNNIKNYQCCRHVKASKEDELDTYAYKMGTTVQERFLEFVNDLAHKEINPECYISDKMEAELFRLSKGLKEIDKDYCVCLLLNQPGHRGVCFMVDNNNNEKDPQRCYGYDSYNNFVVYVGNYIKEGKKC